MGAQQAARRGRRAERFMQQAFKQQGTHQRVMAAYRALQNPLLHRELASRCGGTLDAQALAAAPGHARNLLTERGLDCTDVEITAAINPATGALALRADADPIAQGAARRLADRLALQH